MQPQQRYYDGYQGRSPLNPRPSFGYNISLFPLFNGLASLAYLMLMMTFFVTTFVYLDSGTQDTTEYRNLILLLNVAKIAVPVLIMFCCCQKSVATECCMMFGSFVGCVLIVSVFTFTTLVYDRFSNSNVPSSVGNSWCNDPLICCAYYNKVASCLTKGPCLVVNVTEDNIPLPNNSAGGILTQIGPDQLSAQYQCNLGLGLFGFMIPLEALLLYAFVVVLNQINSGTVMFMNNGDPYANYQYDVQSNYEQREDFFDPPDPNSYLGRSPDPLGREYSNDGSVFGEQATWESANRYDSATSEVEDVQHDENVEFPTNTTNEPPPADITKIGAEIRLTPDGVVSNQSPIGRREEYYSPTAKPNDGWFGSVVSGIGSAWNQTVDVGKDLWVLPSPVHPTNYGRPSTESQRPPPQPSTYQRRPNYYNDDLTRFNSWSSGSGSDGEYARAPQRTYSPASNPNPHPQEGGLVNRRNQNYAYPPPQPQPNHAPNTQRYGNYDRWDYETNNSNNNQGQSWNPIHPTPPRQPQTQQYQPAPPPQNHFPPNPGPISQDYTYFSQPQHNAFSGGAPNNVNSGWATGSGRYAFQGGY